MALRVRYWGSRGSIPTPGPQTARYGGNTSCVAVEPGSAQEPEILVLDAGTGIRLLGNDLLERNSGNGGLAINLLLTHTHWDHIQGLPFFTPLAGQTNQIRIFGARQGSTKLESILRQQMHPAVFPIPLDDLDADLSVKHLEGSELEIGGFTVQYMRVRHPGNTLAYRIQETGGGASLAFVPDNELGSGGDYQVGDNWRGEFVQFLSGVDVLIHDAMYTSEQLDTHRGWGHSSFGEAVELAAEAKVGQLVLFHHRPDHDDDDMDRLLQEARGAAADLDKSLEVVAAIEGSDLTV